MAFKVAMKGAPPQAAMDPSMLAQMQAQQAAQQQAPAEAPEAEEAQETPEEEASEQTPDGDEQPQGGPVDPQIAGYMGPEHGPFMCGNCVYFDGHNGCQIVSGEIDQMGCCNLFTPAGKGQDEDAEGMEQEAAPDAEAPAEPAEEPAEEPTEEPQQ
jgi:hypothetical protein